jgi:hypothetical protein
MPSRNIVVGTSQADLVEANRNRVSITVFNTHSSATLYIKEGSEVSSTNGIPVYSGGSAGITFREDGELVFERFVIISDTADTTVIVVVGLVK